MTSILDVHADCLVEDEFVVSCEDVAKVGVIELGEPGVEGGISAVKL